jgi:hypothetical protein
MVSLVNPNIQQQQWPSTFNSEKAVGFRALKTFGPSLELALSIESTPPKSRTASTRPSFPMLSLAMCSSAPSLTCCRTPNHFPRILTCGISVMKSKKGSNCARAARNDPQIDQFWARHSGGDQGIGPGARWLPRVNRTKSLLTIAMPMREGDEIEATFSGSFPPARC